MDKISISRVKLLGKPVPYWWRYAYLIPDVFQWDQAIVKNFEKVLAGKDSVFIKFVEKQVKDFIEKGVEPPQEIAAPIMNIAEDLIAGREATMRAGDYIALENFRRTKLRRTRSRSK